MPKRSVKILLITLVVGGLWHCQASMTVIELQRRLGWRKTEAVEGGVVVSCKKDRLRLTEGSRQADCSGTLVWLHTGVGRDLSGGLYVSALDANKTLIPILTRARRVGGARRLRVMLDPGHGGDDSGAVAGSNGLEEKEVVADIAKRVAGYLRAAGHQAELTRGDGYLSLSERVESAAAWGADVLVSIHANSAGNPLASGQETYLLPFAGESSTAESTIPSGFQAGNRHDTANALLGYAVHRQFQLGKLGADRGVKRARFQVLRDAPCPAALIEVGFLSNASDAKKLAGRRHRRRLAKAIARGVGEYARLR